MLETSSRETDVDTSSGSSSGGESGEPGTPGGYEEVSALVGIDVTHQSDDMFSAKGAAWADVDGDGRLDVFLTSQFAANTLLLQGDAGVFEAVGTGEAPFALPEVLSTGAVFVDYDNDGRSDLHVLGRGPNTLLRNLGDQEWDDVSSASGLGDPGYGQTAAWADYDADGFIDVYVVNYASDHPDRLFRNNGDGSFVDVSAVLDESLRALRGFSATFFDYDLDGDVDLYVVNDKHDGNTLWRNEGAGCGGWCFSDVSSETGAGVEMESMGIAVGDYDNDGDQDVFVTNRGPMVLLRNETSTGQPGFTEVAAEAGALVDDPRWGQYGWGTQFLDYDNDGWLDLYVTLGRVGVGPSRPNVLLRNLGDGTFERLRDAGGAEDPRRSQGLAVADYDEDGWVDLLVANADEPYALFHNTGQGGRWLEVQLEGDGTSTARDALGAKVFVTDDEGRVQLREVIAGTSLGAGSSLRQHFGFGAAEPVAVHVEWPDGLTSDLVTFEPNTVLSVVHPGR